MLNAKTGERELCYLVIVNKIESILGYDRIELAHIDGWTVVVGKGEFKAGDIAIYFEIDSKLPEEPPFSDSKFIISKHYKIETQRMCKGQVYSQGLLMSISQFGWEQKEDSVYNPVKKTFHKLNDNSRFLTKELNITYASPKDNKRKRNSFDKYKRMEQRHPKLFKHQIIQRIMKTKVGKEILFFLFGKKKDKKGAFPSFVKKTDEERIENMTFLLKDKSPWIATEKIDGSSTTFAIKRGRFPFSKNTIYICSRNVLFDNPNAHCYYDSNIYFEMAEKYNIKVVLNQILKDLPKEKWIYIQGETYGANVQKRDYSTPLRDFRAFNLVTSTQGRWNTLDMRDFLIKYHIESIPVLNENYILPDTIEELRKYVDSQPSLIDGKMREGIVFRSLDGSNSFKCVSPMYLIKYHS